ncbi:MAG: hypothetical protein DI531_14685 [Brevundimonas sp.]|uniref:hypothetical protein n=1 Tax=Brevundimonas sp. TaxID=1871086 RepID=UPI000DB7A8CB|nr:hypothetical protein [Brevundimonas sp.]PZU71899.1 MAG: hypothetical protein DI531_14685 [Brevundimonas sp.]
MLVFRPASGGLKGFFAFAALLLATPPAHAEPTVGDLREASFECAAGHAALVDIRARLAITYQGIGDQACVAFAPISSREVFSRLALVLMPFDSQTHLQIYAKRTDGGWTDLTPSVPTIIYDHATDRLQIAPLRTRDLPTLFVLRNGSQIALVFDRAHLSYQAIPLK